MTRSLLLALLVLCAGVAVSASTAWAGPEVSVPAVEGLELDHAVRRLESAHLQVSIGWTATGDAGRVQQQRPAQGARVPAGTTVELLVAHRVRIDTIVPDVVGLDAREAIGALEDVYDVQVEERPVSRRRAGEVLAQEPRAGARLPVGGALRLAVGRTRRARIELPLPDVQHMALDEAEGALLDLGLVPVPTFVRTRHAGQGRVRRQDPAPGTAVTHGTHVALVVGHARGPARRVRVPSLYGLDPTEAAGALDALGLSLRVERLPSHFPQDTVIRQNPRAGTLATPGSAVRLAVAFPAGRTHVPARTPVPQLTGVDLAEAFALARRAGILLDLHRREGTGRGSEDAVLAQRPTARVAVPLGTRVRVEVSFGTLVPDLIGTDPGNAAMRVWAAGLRLELEGGLHRRPGMLVISQTPAAGTIVPRDTLVRAVTGREPSGLVTVPAVLHRSVAQAQYLLRAVGLDARFSGPPIPPGRATFVVAQKPLAGAHVAPGATIAIAYQLTSAEPPVLYVRVPDLRGLSLMDAHRALGRRGLVGEVGTVRGPGPKGVTGQDPDPGTRVRRGVKVRFTVRR